MTAPACPICLEGPHGAGGPLACQVLADLTARAAHVDVPPRLEHEVTRHYLARVLEANGAPGHMVSLARDGHYDDFVSPLAMPEIQLLHDARDAGLDTIALLVVVGAFDATKAESDAWAASPEGQATYAELTRPNRAQRRRRR